MMTLRVQPLIFLGITGITRGAQNPVLPVGLYPALPAQITNFKKKGAKLGNSVGKKSKLGAGDHTKS